jgi:transaldolase
MKFFLDTANLDEIKDALETGLISGITTNPSLMAKEPKTNFYTHISKIADLCELYDGIPLSVEVFATEPRKILEQAYDIRTCIPYKKLNIKIPVGYEELKIINKLSEMGIPINCTCCFTTTQMQLAAAAGARYVSLFYNRLLDAKGNPIQTLQRTRSFLDSKKLNCEIIAGSIRNAYDIEDAWHAGAHIVTAGHSILKKATKHPKTDESVNQFLSDFKEWIG